MSFFGVMQSALAGTRLLCDAFNFLDVTRKTFESNENSTILKVCSLGCTALSMTTSMEEMKAKLLGDKLEELVSIKKREQFFIVSNLFCKLLDCGYNRLTKKPSDYDLTQFGHNLLAAFRSSEELLLYEIQSTNEVEKIENCADVEAYKDELSSSRSTAIILGSLETALQVKNLAHQKKLNEFDSQFAKCIPSEYHKDIIFSRYKCPLTHKPIRFIVGDPDGIHFYEKEAIINWLRRGIGNSPANGQLLEISELIELPAQQSLIERRIKCLRGRL